jgi:hypothetical protein
MLGRRAINHIYDWLGLGSMGEPYEVLPTVQPVVQVDALPWPLQVRNFAAVVPYAAAATTVFFMDPPPNNITQRLWLQIWVNRTVILPLSVLQLRAGVIGQQNILWEDQIVSMDQGAVISTRNNIFTPVVGGKALLDINAIHQFFDTVALVPVKYNVSVPLFVQGMPPLAHTPDVPLQFAIASPALGAGNLNITGVFVDLPLSAPLTFILPR